MTVEIALVNPKFRNNLGMIIRASACFGADRIWYSGNRMDLKPGERIPREERLYKEVELVREDYFITKAKGLTPVVVELLPGAENIVDFEHPENALYIFGPEDGSVPASYRRLAHKFIQIPSLYCVSLPAAVYLTLYDRLLKNEQSRRMAPASRDLSRVS